MSRGTPAALRSASLPAGQEAMPATDQPHHQPAPTMSQPPPPPDSSIVLHRTDDGRTRAQCRFEGSTNWLTQSFMSKLFTKDVRTIDEPLAHLFDEGELDRAATIRSFRMVRTEGARQVAREIEHFSLPAILAVVYRARSPRGTHFHRWATTCLSAFLVQGFARCSGPEPITRSHSKLLVRSAA